MTRVARWLRRSLLGGLGLAAAAACAPEYDFVPDKKAEHCSNDIRDPSAGETDVDCGGPCKACGLGQECGEPRDCAEGGQCIDGFCQAPGCNNGANDGDETGVDCGGGMCKGCEAGEPCDVPRDCASEVCTGRICQAPTCDDGVRNGTETGQDCGGGVCSEGCGTGSPCTTAADCRSGVCAGVEGAKKCEISCLEGTDECDGDPEVECETNVLTDPMHCNDCETVCELANAEQSCVSGRCMIASCREPYENCDNRVETGCETNLRTDAAHCGMCGNECSDDNGTPSCVNSECQIECNDGFDDCDDEPGNGCERSVATDVQACGNCTTVCPFNMGETPFCVEGECGATVCPDGLGNCDGAGDSCEQDLTSDVQNCGRCGGLCTVSHGTPRCVDETCGVQSCEDGWDNCDTTAADGGYANGCETNTDVDVLNCGACGNDCTVANGGATCVDGECRVMTCDDGWFNCDSGNSDGGYANGCETNIAADKTNCGICGRNCDTLFASANATGRCQAGICQRDQCLPNFGDCDTNPANCESDFRSDESDCGNCDTACSPTGVNMEGNECLSGTCTPHCATGRENCDSQGPNGCEINTNTSVAHCGGCNQPCTGGRPCINGMCGCSGTLELCDDECVNTATDNTNCGDCGVTCTGGRTCVNSVCQCPMGQTFCSGPGVCVNTQTDRMNCGMCGTVCQLTGATSNNCSGGVCQPMCNTPTTRGDCDMNPVNGCEATFASNNAHCGACGRACQTTGANVNVTSNMCSAGAVCQPMCVTNFGDCDGMPWNGCEANITMPATCGMSCTACVAATPACVLSGMTRSCQATIAMAGAASFDGIQGATLTFPHNLTVTTGNRMLVVGVVARSSPTGGAAQARPDSVTYNNVALTAGPEFDGGTPVPGTDGQSHLFFYYLPNAMLPTTTGSRDVVVDGSPGTLDPSIVAAMAVTLTGVRQSNPLTAPVSGSFTTCSNSAPVVQPSNAVTLATTGSVILSLSGAQHSGDASPAPSLTMLMDNETSPMGTNPSPMRALGGIRGHTSQLASPGPHTVGWNYQWCNNSVHLAVVVNPAQQ